MSSWALDASALLALIHSEPGAEVVAAAISDAVTSAVNLSEVVAKLTEAARPEGEIRGIIAGYGVEVADFDEGLAYRASMLRPLTRARGLSLGDRAGLALAQQLNLPVLTADRSWSELDIGVEVRVIR